MVYFHDVNWFAIHTRKSRENLAATNVAAHGLEIFLPKIKSGHAHPGPTADSSRPLFPGYFFARFCPENWLGAVQYSRGVLQVVSSGRWPIPVDDEVIREIQERVEADGLIRIRPQELRPGARVSIQQGPLEGMMGRVEQELDDQMRVAILLETLWDARVVVEKQWLQAEAA